MILTVKLSLNISVYFSSTLKLIKLLVSQVKLVNTNKQFIMLDMH